MIEKLILSPITGIYWILFQFHQFYLSNKGVKIECERIPLLVVGALKAGGSGKTTMVIELARYFNSLGIRVGIIAYWLNKKSRKDWKVVEDDWVSTSDEGLLIKENLKLDTIVTRNREKVWNELSKTGKYDLLISDDGFQDPRLKDAYHLVLQDQKEKPGWYDLIPKGKYRETHKALRRANRIFPEPELTTFEKIIPEPLICRTLNFPKNFDYSEPRVVLCALGNNEQFAQHLKISGVNVIKTVYLRDHHHFDEKFLSKLKKRFPQSKFVSTEKDGIKLRGEKLKGIYLTVIPQKLRISEKLLQELLFELNFGKFLKSDKLIRV